MEKYTAEEIKSINDEIYYLAKLLDNNFDKKMHLSCNTLLKNFTGISSISNICNNLDDCNKRILNLKLDTVDLTKEISSAVIRAEDTNW